MTFPPPTSISDVAFCVTAHHREGGTWSALGSSVEDVLESMHNHRKAFPGSYTGQGEWHFCYPAQTKFGLVWRLAPRRSKSTIWFRGDGYTARDSNALTLDGRRCCDLAPDEDALFMVRGKSQLQRRRPDGFDPVRDDPQMSMPCAGEPVDGVHGEGGGSR